MTARAAKELSTGVHSVDRARVHVRALRGDYCGDGVPFTVNGTMVNLYDGVGIQLDTQDWDVDAAWTPDGAACISKKTDTRFWQTSHAKPS